MSDNNNLSIDTELLVDYAHGLLRPEQAAKVKEALERSEELRWQYEGILYLISEHPASDPEMLLSDTVQQVQNRVAASVRGVKKKDTLLIRMWKPATIAASIILIIGLILLRTHYKTPADPVLIASQLTRVPYNDRFEAEYHVRGGTGNAWEADFKNGDYKAVIQDLSILPDSIKGNREEFFLGLAFLKSIPSNLPAAETHLNKSAVEPNDYQADAWYYLSLIQLLQHNTSQARVYLKDAAETGHEAAKELLERLPK